MGSNNDVYGGRSRLTIVSRQELVRTAINIDNDEFVRRSGIGASAYGDILAGIDYPHISVIFSMCYAFKIAPNWILTGDPGSLKHSFADLLDRLHK